MTQDDRAILACIGRNAAHRFFPCAAHDDARLNVWLIRVDFPQRSDRVDQRHTPNGYDAFLDLWLCSPQCDLESGAVVNLRSQPELQEKIDRVLKDNE